MKNNRLGVLLILSSLVVIGLVIGLLVARQQQASKTQIRTQGVGITRALAALPPDVLIAAPGRASVLPSFVALYESPLLAYAAVTDLEGRVLSEAAAPGVIVPAAPPPRGTASLFGERQLDAQGNRRSIREFFGPVMRGTDPAGFVRVGFFEAPLMLAWTDLSFFAALALPVFLLVPLFIFSLKREMRPLAALSAQVEELAARQPGSALAVPEADMRSFAQRLQQYVEDAHRRIRGLEEERSASIAEGRLLEYKYQKSAAVLQALPDAVMILDPAGEVSFAGSKIEALLGVHVQDVLTRPIAAWCTDPELLGVLTQYRSGSPSARTASMVEFTPHAALHRRIRATCEPVVALDGTLGFGTLVVLHDATREYLGQQAGNDFVAHVSHELKSPLNVLAMYSEMLQGEAMHDETLRVEAVNVIHDEVQRMNLLVGNLLNVSKMEMGSLQPQRSRVRLNDLLQEVFNNALPLGTAKGLTMDLKTPPDLAAVMIDKDLVQIALNNLMTNAIKYNVPGGMVRLSADETEQEVVVRVRDTGIGIPPEAQEHVFEKFYRAPNGQVAERSGHGLGLYLASEIVEMHHGLLTVTSREGEGSEFAIHLKKVSAVMQGANIL